MTDEPEDPNRPNNLWSPVPGDAGAHGRFDARASRWSWEVKASEHRSWVMALALVAGGALLANVLR